MVGRGPDTLQQSWAAYFTQMAGQYAVDLSSHEAAEHLVETLACFCRRRIHEAVLPEAFSPLLLARVLYCTGRTREAERVLEQSQTGHVEAWRRLIAADEVTASIWSFVAARVVRPGAWVTLHDEPLWILDLNRLAPEDGPLHEMLFLNVIRLLVEKLAPLWAECGGAGVLGVKGLGRTVFRQAADGSFSAQMEHYLRDLMQWMARQNRWSQVPQVRNVDL
jgi:hypothetical protein